MDERDTTCCYARQDKFWVQGAPGGERWEIYTVLEDSQTFWGSGEQSWQAAEGVLDAAPNAASAAALDAGQVSPCSGTAPEAAGREAGGPGRRLLRLTGQAPCLPGEGSVTVALWRRLVAELLGSGFLAAVVIGSGIAAQRLSPGQAGLELLENAAATAAGLFAIILMFGPVSGGHFNPLVSFADAALGGLRWRDAAAYLPAQVAGSAGGAVIANLMFARAAVSVSAKDRSSPGHFLSEVVATLGLILVIFALARSGRSRAAPAAVGAYIGAAYFFTSSTSFANPAITVGRMFSATFAGIARPPCRASSRPRSPGPGWPSRSSSSSTPGSPRLRQRTLSFRHQLPGAGVPP